MTATTGEQIADAVGLSVRTLWRYFRNKESCVEPIVGQGAAWSMDMLRGWPPERSLEDLYRVVVLERVEPADAELVADNMLLARMLELGKTEPAIRSAWLMACDRVEREMVSIVATRLRRPLDDGDVRVHAAAATAVMRIIDEDLGVAYLADDAEGVVDLWGGRAPGADRPRRHRWSHRRCD